MATPNGLPLDHFLDADGRITGHRLMGDYVEFKTDVKQISSVITSEGNIQDVPEATLHVKASRYKLSVAQRAYLVNSLKTIWLLLGDDDREVFTDWVDEMNKPKTNLLDHPEF